MSEETQTAVTEQIKLPYDAYRLRCLECKKEKSAKSGNNYLRLDLEIFGHADQKYNGLKVQTISAMSDKSLDFFNKVREALGLPLLKDVSAFSTVDPMDYKGAEGAATCKTEEEPQKNEVTGEPIINPNTGKPMVRRQNAVVSWCPRG